MSSRATRRPPSLSSIESLLLAQSVWELGANPSSWAPISKILAKHPLLSRPKSFFTAPACHSLYEALMKDADLEVDDSTTTPHAAVNLQLAQKHYRSRFLELQSLILNEESKFKAVLKEIEDIRAGRLKANEAQGENSNQPSTSQLPAQPSDELFSGSDLSGITESGESDPLLPQTEKELENSKASPGQEAQTEDATPSPEKPEGITQTWTPSPPTSTTPLHQNEDNADEPMNDAGELPNSVQPDEDYPPSVQSGVKNAHTSPMDIAEQSSENNDDIGPTDKLVSSLPAPKPVTGTSPQETMSDQTEYLDQRQEEEEEEAHKEETHQQEEEETSPGHEEEGDLLVEEGDLPEQEGDLPEEEGLKRDPEQEKTETLDDDTAMESDRDEHSVSANRVVDIETESERAQSPAVETAISEAGPVRDDNESSEAEEPVLQTRRSSRRRKSSAASVAPLQPRTRLRSKARVSETESHEAPAAVDTENDGESGMKEDTPQIEEERTSSPFDGAPTRRRDGKRKASFLDSAESPSETKRLREDSEPVDEDEPGPSSHNPRTRITRHATRTEEQVALKRFQNVIGMLHSQISQHRNGNIFHNPIKNSEAPDYHEIVKRPMDLKTIKTRVKDGVIANSLEFQRDIYLMFANAMMYNRPGSDVHAMAEDMMLESEGQINAFRQTEGLVKRGQRP